MNAERRTIRPLLVAFLSIVLAGVAHARYFRTVVIDPGHGGYDKGARWGRVYEKHLALDTAARLEAYLKTKGYRVVMTRRSDYFVSLPGRVAFARKYSKPIFVSVHYNYTWKKRPNGIETYYYTGESQPLATYIQQGVMRRIRTVNRGVKRARFYVIRHAKWPAVLVECGFVSNASERERSKQAWYRQAVAEGIAEGVMKFRHH
jgi:N-acetylmuramoyl-L-alanine amidase